MQSTVRRLLLSACYLAVSQAPPLLPRVVESQLAQFKTRLEEFASKYRHEINRDPQFRHEFAKMTKAVGVE